MATVLRNLEQAVITPDPMTEPASSGIAPGPEVTASPSDPTMLRNLYSTMWRCRMVEERAEQSAHKLKLPLNLRRGLEATVVGSLIELRAGDAISSDESFAARMFARQPLALYFAELYGVRSEYLAFAPEAGNTAIHLLPRAHTMAAQLNLAAGYAYAQKRLKSRNVVTVLLPEGTDALGFWHEAATLAVSERLAIIFVAVRGLNPRLMGNSDARHRAAAYGIPGMTVDGGDVVAVWRVAQESIHRARAGAGPTLIDSQPPAQQARGGDPLDRMQHYLEKRKLWKQSWKDELTQKFASEIDEAQTFFSQTPQKQ
jgi:TPP-dependent pyruvate/acetoin dehydrogenase alpha subunit